MRITFIGFIVILLLSGVARGEGLREHREKSLLKVAEDVRQGILKKDVKTILKYVSKSGIACVDGVIPYEQVKNDLDDHSSWLYTYLFDPVMFSNKYKSMYHPISLYEYFEKSGHVDIKVNFMAGNHNNQFNWAGVHYENSNGIAWPNGSLMFFFRENKWQFVDSPYEC